MSKTSIIHLLSALVGALVATAICCFVTSKQERQSSPIVPQGESALPGYPADTKLDSAMIRALQGDLDSSRAVVQRIDDCATLETQGRSSTHDCAKVQYYWQVVDAENGGSVGISDLFLTLSASAKCADRFRALFWLSKLEVLPDPKKEDRFAGEREALLKSVKDCGN